MEVGARIFYSSPCLYRYSLNHKHMNKKTIAWIVVVLIIVIGSFVLISESILTSQKKEKEDVRAGGTSNLTALTLNDNIVTGGLNSTTTGAAATLGQSDLYAPTGEVISTIAITGSNTATTTITLPASSTLTTFLPNTGDMTSILILNASTTTFALTLASSTGVTIRNSSSTPIVAAGGAAMLIFQRLANTSLNVYSIIFR